MNNSNSTEEKLLFQAVRTGNAEQVRKLIAAAPELLKAYDYSSFGATPVTSACFGNRHDVVQLLLELGADPNRRSDWHMGPWSPLHCAAHRHDKPLMELLLAYGAALDVHAAAALGQVDKLAFLLDASPSRVVERGGDGCYPLHFADSIDAAKLLLERGAEIDGRCIDHYSTAAQYLCNDRPEVARFLFDSGAVVDIFSAILAQADNRVEQLILKDSSLLHAQINQQFFPPSLEHDVHNILTFVVGSNATPLHTATKSNHLGMIEKLVRLGISVNVRGGYDDATSLHVAAWNNRVETAKKLITLGADINMRSGKIHNNSPAGWAIVAGSADVFEYLVEQGADILDWFEKDAQDAVNGQFDSVCSANSESRKRILERLRK